MIMPAPPGAVVDLAGRMLAEGLARRGGHPIVVENRPGGDGMIGAGAFAQARAGEALFYSFVAAVTVVPLMHEGRLPFDPDADLVPISTGAADFFVLSVAPALPVHTLAEFVEHGRTRPGGLNWFALPGAPYLAFRAFLRDAAPGRLDMTYVPYRGTPPALLDLAAGRIHAVLAPLAVALPLAREGRARPLALTGPERAPVAPEIPTAAEAGGCRASGWRGCMACSAGAACPRRRGRSSRRRPARCSPTRQWPSGSARPA
jgi:tripartite-type tricarboxylate transporter receptor subunit TctC